MLWGHVEYRYYDTLCFSHEIIDTKLKQHQQFSMMRCGSDVQLMCIVAEFQHQLHTCVSIESENFAF